MKDEIKPATEETFEETIEEIKEQQELTLLERALGFQFFNS